MEIFNKYKLRTPVEHGNKATFDSQHITTSDFFQCQPIFVKELVPHSSLKINAGAFARLESMKVPTFGRCTLNLRGFWIPFRTVYRGWSDFITDSVHNNSNMSSSVPSTVPYITALNLNKVLFGRDMVGLTCYEVTDSSAPADFSIAFYDSSNVYETTVRYNLLPLGRVVYKVLLSLGYKFSPQQGPTMENIRYSALPLLSFLRAYVDYYQSGQFANTNNNYRYIDQLLNRDNGSLNLSYSDVWNAVKACVFSNYDDDYFTSAWENPAAPVDNTFSGVRIDDNQVPLDSYHTAVSTLENGTPVARGVKVDGLYQQYGYVSNFSQYIDSTLKKLTAFFKRNQLSGTRAFQRYKARFGQELSNVETRRCDYLGSKKIDLQVGDIYSTAQTDDAMLGDYAGRGLIAGNCDFECNSGSDYGIFMIVASIVPKAGYYQGIDRSILQLSRFDFWSPEFDGLGCQAISKAELMVPTQAPSNAFLNDYTDGIFGFAPRYAHYKVHNDKLTGDFVLKSRNLGKDSWHLMRSFDEVLDPSDIVHSQSFLRGVDEGDASDIDYKSQYDRIFNYTAGNTDHFNMFYMFNFSILSPLKPLYDVYEFDEEKGKEIKMRLNGLQLN